MQPFYRPPYVSCPSISLSIRMSVQACNSKNAESQNRYKCSRAKVNGLSIFCWKDQRSRSAEIKNLKKLPHIWYTFTYRQWIKCRWLKCRLQTRPVLDLIYCQHLRYLALDRQPHVSANIFSCFIYIRCAGCSLLKEQRCSGNRQSKHMKISRV